MAQDDARHPTPVPGDNVDFALALAAGPNAWVTPDSASTPMLRAGFVMTLIAAFASAAIVAAEVAESDHRALALRVVLVAIAGAATLLLSSSTIAALRRQNSHGGRMGMTVLRLGAGMTCAVIWISTISPWTSLRIWPLGLFSGTEAAIVAVLTGHVRRGRQLLANYLLSPYHLGAVAAALFAASVVRSEFVVRLFVTSVLSLEIVALAAIGAYSILSYLFRVESAHRADVRMRERASEFKRRAHWIHDDVCADIRELRVKMAMRTMDQAEVSQHLDLLDDRLRERQLDEMVGSGVVSAAEIIQPYVRRAQNSGVDIIEVPYFDEASVVLPEEPARVLRRCTAGFVSNALNAGATRLGIRLLREGDDLVLSVLDNAGGFELAKAPGGRGLGSLASELGPNGLFAERRHDGMVMTARIPVGSQR